MLIMAKTSPNKVDAARKPGSTRPQCWSTPAPFETKIISTHEGSMKSEVFYVFFTFCAGVVKRIIRIRFPANNQFIA
jgi:hypothetical protein